MQANKYFKLAALCAALSASAFANAAPVTTVTSDFSGFTAGSVNGQGGWGVSNPAFDQEVVNIGGANGNVLRLSNKVTAGSFGDQPFAPRPGGTAMTAANPTNSAPQFFAGETSTGAAFNRYIGSFDFRSVATGNTDLGARITMSPDNGQGGRQGFIQLANTAAGVAVTTFDLNAVGGFVGPATLATVAFASWNTLRYEIDFFDGAFNDVANIFLNNTLVSTINSWESFYSVLQPVQHPNGVPVQTWLFRLSSVPAVPNAQGFYIDNVSVQLDNRSNAVPEPGTALLIGLAGAAMFAVRRRQNRA